MHRKLAVLLIPAVVLITVLTCEFSAEVVETQTAQARNTGSRSIWDGVHTLLKQRAEGFNSRPTAVYATGPITQEAVGDRR